MFGVETKAAQPLRTGDNICPPSLSVLPSIMVRPLSPLRLFILPFFTPLPSFFLPRPSTPALLLTPSPLSAKQAETGHPRCCCCSFLLFLFFPLQPFLYSLHFLEEDIYSSSSTPLTLLCSLIWIHATVFYPLFFFFIICAYSFLRMMNTFMSVRATLDDTYNLCKPASPSLLSCSSTNILCTKSKGDCADMWFCILNYCKQHLHMSFSSR